MADSSNTPPPAMTPSSIGEMGTHLAYMRRDMDELKSTNKEIILKLDNLGTSYVEMHVFSKHLEADADHETRIRALETALSDLATIKKLVYGMVSFILVSVIGAIINIVLKH